MAVSTPEVSSSKRSPSASTRRSRPSSLSSSVNTLLSPLCFWILVFTGSGILPRIGLNPDCRSGPLPVCPGVVQAGAAGYPVAAPVAAVPVWQRCPENHGHHYGAALFLRLPRCAILLAGRYSAGL